MMQEILTSESFWFWALVVVQSCLIVWFVDAGNLPGSVFSLLTLFVGIALFPSQWPTIGLGAFAEDGFWGGLRETGWTLLAGLALYVLLGLGWAMLRWWVYVRMLREEYERRKAGWLTPGNLVQAAARLRERAEMNVNPADRERCLAWASCCQAAAQSGGRLLTAELKPVWKDYVQNGYRH